MHGFLRYLLKQVRDNIHSEDVSAFMYEFGKAPRVAEVYNFSGGKGNACSILEAFQMAEDVTGKKKKWRYVDENRIGDHICYYSDLRKMQQHYPGWKLAKTLPMIFDEIAAGWKNRLPAHAG